MTADVGVRSRSPRLLTTSSFVSPTWVRLASFVVLVLVWQVAAWALTSETFVAAVQAIAGQIAEPNAIIFQIVDPSRYWVEALSYEAYALKESATGRLGDNRTVPLIFRGAGLADRNQAIPIHFSVEENPEGIRAGQLLTVLSSTMEKRTGIAVPRTSVLRGSNGQSLVYEHTNAERFVPREVRTEPLDGDRLLVVSGIEAGKRIVTQGAELLNQIR